MLLAAIRRHLFGGPEHDQAIAGADGHGLRAGSGNPLLRACAANGDDGRVAEGRGKALRLGGERHANERMIGGDVGFFQSHLQSPAVHDGVEKINEVRLARQRGHAVSAQPIR